MLGLKNKNQIILEACLHCKSVSFETSDLLPLLSSRVKPQDSTNFKTTWNINYIIKCCDQMRI